MTRYIRAIMVSLATLAIPLAALAAPQSARAAGPHLCESSGSYCVGAPDLSEFAPVVETTTGRDLQRIDLGGGQVKLEFTAATGMCVAATNDGTRIDIKACNGPDGTVWLEQTSNGHWLYESREFSSRGLYLCGLNDGSQFLLESLGVGAFCRFDWS